MRFQYVLLGLVGLIAAVALASSTNSMKPKGPTEPDLPATDIAIQAVNDHNRVVSLSSLKGKVVLVDFWATWCGPCRLAIPGIQKLYEKQHAKGFEVLGVSMDQQASEVPSFLREMKMTYPAGLPTNPDQARPYASGSIPQMVLVDRNGTVRWLPPPGFSPQMETELGERVERLLKE
jgi:thiol-disulfide isomerase/thioredoxin